MIDRITIHPSKKWQKQEIMDMTDVKTGNLVRTAMFAALTCIATFIIKIPTPGTGGYIHPGDALVILSGIFLGPLYGAAAAGIGSAMADILGGYFFYAPVTMLIKGITAFCALNTNNTTIIRWSI